MIDFRLLNTPEARERAKQRRKELEEKFANEEKQQREMITFLQSIESELTPWEFRFVASVACKCGILTLTDKQKETLTKIHNQYKWNR